MTTLIRAGVLAALLAIASPVHADSLTSEELRTVVEQTWPEQHVERAIRVALCESNGRSWAVNRGFDRFFGHYASLGLFQIETLATAAWQNLAGMWYPDGNEIWFDATRNSRIAAEIQRQQGWGAWPWCGRG